MAARHSARRAEPDEKAMFGGMAWMLNGHLLCGSREDGMLARVGPARNAWALGLPDVTPMVMRGRGLAEWSGRGRRRAPKHAPVSSRRRACRLVAARESGERRRNKSGFVAASAPAPLINRQAWRRGRGTRSRLPARRFRTASRRPKIARRSGSSRRGRGGPIGTAFRRARAAAGRTGRAGAQGRRQAHRLRRHVDRRRAERQDFPRRAGRRAGDVPGLAEGVVRRVEQRDDRAGAIRHVGEIVRRVGRADERSAAAAHDRPECRVAEMAEQDARSIEIRRPQRGDAQPPGFARRLPDARRRDAGRRLDADRLQRRRFAERRRLRAVHVEVVEEDEPRLLGGAGVDKIGHRSRPRLAPHGADIGKADRQHDLRRAGDRRAHACRVKRVAATEIDARRQVRRRLALRHEKRAPRGGKTLDGRRADRAIADDANFAAHVALPVKAETVGPAAAQGYRPRHRGGRCAVFSRYIAFSAACGEFLRCAAARRVWRGGARRPTRRRRFTNLHKHHCDIVTHSKLHTMQVCFAASGLESGFAALRGD